MATTTAPSADTKPTSPSQGETPALDVELLVLDVSGVLFEPAVRRALDGLARVAGLTTRTQRDLQKLYDNELRQPLLTGQLDEDEFLRIVVDHVGFTADTAFLDAMRNHIAARLEPKPACRHVDSWAQQVPVWLLTNHRHEWLDPALADADLTDTIDRVFVSSRMQATKPATHAFKQLVAAAQRRGVDPQTVVYVDDLPANCTRAAALGLTTVDGTNPEWPQAVDRMLA